MISGDTLFKQIKYIEIIVMLVTLLRWLFLGTLTGVIVGMATRLGDHAVQIFDRVLRKINK